MTLLIILLVLFAVLALVVTLTEKFGKPMEAQQQAKLSKIIPILVFLSLFIVLIKNFM